MTKRLLITSDDFGMCHAINMGIVRAMREGVVRATNLMAPCPWFMEAVALTREHALPVGVHVCLTCDWDRLKWGPLTRAPGLCDTHGHLFQSFEPLLAQASDDEILRELFAQVERVCALGIRPSHLSSHMLGSSQDDPGALRLKSLIVEVARQSDIRYTYQTDEHGTLRYFDAEVGLSGRDKESVWSELAALPDGGTYHLIGHAAEASPELDALCSPEHRSRNWAASYRTADQAFFTSPSTRARLAELGLELTTHAEL